MKNSTLVRGLFVVGLTLCLQSCYVGHFIIWNFADVGDAERFPSRIVKHSDTTFQFIYPRKEFLPDFPVSYYKMGDKNLEDFMYSSQTLALLIIRNDTLLFERYLPPLDSAGKHPAFSAAKSFVSALVGIAIEEGIIKSVHDPITLYLPELKHDGMERVTIDHLLQMRTGFQYSEGYFNPFGNVAKYYYGRNILKYIPELYLGEEPGTSFKYVSVATQLLGIIVERASGMKLEKYLEEKIWIPLGMESDASWSIDSKKFGMVKAFCCLNASARDFAKFGRLYLNKGNWNGKQIISESWVDRSSRPYTEDQKFYSTQWWLLGKNRFAAIGFLGQYIVVDPKKNTIIVRLGKKEGGVDWIRLIGTLMDEL